MSEYAVVRTWSSMASPNACYDLEIMEWPPAESARVVGALATVPTTLERAQSALMAFVCGGEVPDELIYRGDPT